MDNIDIKKVLSDGPSAKKTKTDDEEKQKLRMLHKEIVCKLYRPVYIWRSKRYQDTLKLKEQMYTEAGQFEMAKKISALMEMHEWESSLIMNSTNYSDDYVDADEKDLDEVEWLSQEGIAEVKENIKKILDML